MSEFQIMEKADEKQIVDADKQLKEILVYSVKGKKALTIGGVKWLILKMSQKEQPTQVHDVKIELVKHDPEDPTQWIWYAQAYVTNLKTKLQTVGISEQPYSEYAKYDQFGRTKASSKAERNAYRKQIPENEILNLLNNIGSEYVMDLDSNTSNNNNQNDYNNTPRNGVLPKQLKALQDLGYKGKIPSSAYEAGKLLYQLQK